ncbi:hypothetical protein FZEAL_7109 [Fusarium zealandicum]|uniref:Uncharacterized protein n=1 Tax=Fusarium zealandicum TaxID=1053134 RepID=A0A8H4UHA9_9HYPO|nr:hypothetical protein FZEAL_7109 [Fusarium zealandicum]
MAQFLGLAAFLTLAAVTGEHLCPAVGPVDSLIRDIDLERASNPFSNFISCLMAMMMADVQTGIGYGATFIWALSEAVCPGNMDVAMTAFNVMRIPTNSVTPPEHYDHHWTFAQCARFAPVWQILQYCLATVFDWGRLREFLELSNKINRLTTAYCSVENPEAYWPMLQGKYFADGPPPMDLGPHEDLATPDNWSHRRCISGLLKKILEKSLLLNSSPGQKPKNIAGQPIDTNLFARVQRQFWIYERNQRSTILADLEERGLISFDMGVLRAWSAEEHPGDVSPFINLLFLHRIDIITGKLGLAPESTQSICNLLKWHDVFELGMQGLVKLLPQPGDDYTRKFLFDMAELASRVKGYFDNFPAGDREWRDGWFERFSVAMPDDGLAEDDEDETGPPDMFVPVDDNGYGADVDDLDSDDEDSEMDEPVVYVGPAEADLHTQVAEIHLYEDDESDVGSFYD